MCVRPFGEIVLPRSLEFNLRFLGHCTFNLTLIKMIILLLFISTVISKGEEVKYYLSSSSCGLDEDYNNRIILEIELDSDTLNPIGKFKEVPWMNKIKSKTIASYYKVYYKKKKRIYAEHISITPYTYVYGKALILKKIKELKIKEIFEFDNKERTLVYKDNVLNILVTYIYSKNMIEVNYFKNNKLQRISKSFYKKNLCKKRSITIYESLVTCDENLKLKTYELEYDSNKDIKLYSIYKYSPKFHMSIYDKNGVFKESYPPLLPILKKKNNLK